MNSNQGNFCRLLITICCTFLMIVVHCGCFNSKVKFFRKTFDLTGNTINKGLEKHVTGTVVCDSNITYSPGDPDALMDVYYTPEAEQNWDRKPAILWVPGGGWIAGGKHQ